MSDCPKCKQGKIHDRTYDFITADAEEKVRIDGCRLCGWITFPGHIIIQPQDTGGSHES
jgi:hypothetical protein